MRYVPLDETLDRDTVRVLRALRHFDGARSLDLRIATGLSGNAVIWALRNMLRAGRVERLGPSSDPLWSVTDAGERWLRDQLGRADLDRELAFVRDHSRAYRARRRNAA